MRAVAVVALRRLQVAELGDLAVIALEVAVCQLAMATAAGPRSPSRNSSWSVRAMVCALWQSEHVGNCSSLFETEGE